MLDSERGHDAASLYTIGTSHAPTITTINPTTPRIAIITVADFSRSFHMRQGRRYPLNFENLFLNGDLSQNLALEPGDYLSFPGANVKEVYVLGEVRQPGAVHYMPER